MTQQPLFVPKHVEPSVQLKDNGIHRYYEDKHLLLLNNHGPSVWSALQKKGGSYKVLSHGEEDFEALLAWARKERTA